MREYDFLRKMLSDKYLASNQTVMKEENVQTAHIEQSSDVAYSLYRFETTGDKDILQFFDTTNDAPKNLRAFCDYVILAEFNEKPYVMLVELKSGDVAHANCQLEASQCFVEYLRNTAVRIKDINDSPNFDNEALRTVKIVLTPVKTRRTTRIDGNSQIKNNGGYLSYATTSFNLSYVCRFINKR